MFEFIQIISFFNEAHLNSGVRLLLEFFCVIAIKHATFFTICAKLLVTMAFPFTFPDVIVASALKKNIGESRDLGKKGTDRRKCMPLFTHLDNLTYKCSSC